MKTYAVIMAGGAGTRFWPASRADRPKQLLPLGAHPEEPLLAATVRRLAPVIPPENIWIATGARLAEATARTLPGVPRAQILSEPVPRNTAPCIGWATSVIAKIDPDAIVCVLPSDHFMADEDGFRATVVRALDAAKAGHLATIGIVPTRPETGYGYIELGDRLPGGDDETYAVARFVEKPDRARAEAYVSGGRHLWNAGMFFFRAGAMLDAIEKHLPELAAGLAKLDRGEDLASVFPTLPSVSIDHGVMEKASGLAVVKGDFGWNDVGSWESAWELGVKDAAGNVVPPNAVAVDAKNNLVRLLGGGAGSSTSAKTVALVGVSDLVVVDTGDALLVIPRERAQDVRAVVDALKARGATRLL